MPKGLEKLFESDGFADLSEDVKTKATDIFEAAVLAAASKKEATLTEEFDTKLEEATEKVTLEITEKMEEKVNDYLTYAVNEWKTENEIALESGIKFEIAEGFMSGIKGLLEESYIEVPEDKVDMVAEMSLEVDKAEAKVNEAVKVSIQLQEEIEDMKREKIIAVKTEGLSESDVERVASLVEDVEFISEDSFGEKVTSLASAYLDEKKDDKNKKKGDDDDDDDDDDMDESVQTKYASIFGLGAGK